MLKKEEGSQATTPETGSESEESSLTGSCFIVGAPIDEREDITQRGIRALQSADLVVTGDEKHAATLLKRYAISKKLLGIGPAVERDVVEMVLGQLSEGKRVVLLSAPSFMIFPALGRLIAGIRDAGLEPRVMPGVDVATTTLVMSGYQANRYYVAGRLPGRRHLVEDFASNVQRFDVPVVIEGGSARLRSSLEIFAGVMPERRSAVILRPTVPGEVIKRGKLAELPTLFGDAPFRGDWVLVLGPNDFEPEEESADAQGTGETSTVTPGTDVPSTDQQSTDEPGVDVSARDEPSTDEPSTGEPSTGESTPDAPTPDEGSTDRTG